MITGLTVRCPPLTQDPDVNASLPPHPDEILTATLPESLGSPVRSYQPIGHVGNLLLKPEFHPHRNIIAQVVLDKTPQLKSIVMKPLPEPGADPFLPQLPMEHLVGDLDTVVTLQEARCKLTFDFATNEYHRNMTHAHKALLASFGNSKNHIAIAEVDAGVGQLTFPAIRSHILVHANNPDPANHAALISNIPNTTPTACDPRASAFVHATNLPTREFIPTAIRTLLDRSLDPETNQVLWPQPFINPKKPRPAPRIYKFPSVFSHFVIPYSAGGMHLLDSFRGSYAGLGIGERIMPTIHVYAYHASRLPEIARKDFVSQVREGLKFPIDVGELQVECVIKGEKQMSLHRVSFKLPRRVATRARRKMRWEREGKLRWEGEGDVGKTNTTKTEGATESDSGVENKNMEDR